MLVILLQWFTGVATDLSDIQIGGQKEKLKLFYVPSLDTGVYCN